MLILGEGEREEEWEWGGEGNIIISGRGCG
jgi:hypothetical protein